MFRNNNSYFGHFALLVGILFALATSCSKDRFYTEPDAMLRFSVDTLRFDTVFTKRGSATRFFKVYNPYDSWIRIDEIFLEKGNSSMFRLNIDGLPGNRGENLRIAPLDSMYIFAEVTVDPDQPLSISPFVIEEHIVFKVSGNEQKVLLEAWGQNANYVPAFNAQGQQALLSCRNGEFRWDDPRPYVVYGILAIDSCTLTIPEGTRIFVHGGIVRTSGTDFYNDGIIVTLRNGRLNIRGTAENPVVIQSDRLEPEFATVRGQYSGIRFAAGSVGPHFIEHADIRHAIVGVYADSASVVQVKNSKFRYCSSAGLAGVRANIEAENCLFHDNDGGGVAMVYGGEYKYTYCTFSNLNSSRDAMTAQNFICFDPPLCSQGDVFPLRLDVINSILVSAGRDALSLGNAAPGEPAAFRYNFENSLLNLDELLRNSQYADFLERCPSCVVYRRNDPLFKDISMSDFTLDSLSVARGIGRFVPTITQDLRGNIRKSEPDAGCYEFLD